MAKKDEIFFCSDCGNESGKWTGQCLGCGAWNTLVAAPKAPKVQRGSGSRRAPARAQLIPIREASAVPVVRIKTSPPGLDRVLGGGLVPGSLVLLAGSPGIGKSTLLLQAAERLARSGPVVYVSGEESPAQIAMRAKRLDVDASELLLLAETEVDAVLSTLGDIVPTALIVDSIQTMTTADIPSAPGSVAQVRAAAAKLQDYAKRNTVPVILVGHVTKEGHIAGPKLLEHLVDVVLELSTDQSGSLRLLRAQKNRFGATGELALFEMRSSGLEPVRNASEWLLADRQAGAPGSAVSVAMEGSQPLLVEVQALVVASALASPRRVAQGLDNQRLALLLAVLERAGLGRFSQKDIFVKLVGGLSFSEPALDLAIAAAVLGSASDRPLAEDLVLLGEVGLLGEIRRTARSEDRLREAAALGFGRAAGGLNGSPAEGIEQLPMKRIGELVSLLR